MFRRFLGAAFFSNLWQRLLLKGSDLRLETSALLLAYRDKRVPWYARLLAAMVAAYAISPIDLIPDFIPVLGYLDDALLLPLGIYIAINLIPVEVLSECRELARIKLETERTKKGINWMTLIVVVVWAAVLLAFGWFLWRLGNLAGSKLIKP